MAVRSTLLNWCFEHLYARLSFTHEVAGELAFGRAWDARRNLIASAALDTGRGVVLDVGCGEGRLLERFKRAGICCVGVDPSQSMIRRARRRSATVVQGRAQALPVRAASITAVVCTYPGPWIVDSEVHAELARVCVPGAQLHVLVGGDYVRGRGALLRRVLSRIAYGRRDGRQPSLRVEGFEGSFGTVRDTWGHALIWSGRRLGQRSDEGRSAPSNSS